MLRVCYYSQITKKPLENIYGILWSDVVQGGERIMGEDEEGPADVAPLEG